jgi:aerobic-type carbon monoxide dehydrogenase small subunit (CoxS/CutS family)
MGKSRAVLSLSVNGKMVQITSDPDTPLAYVLRNELNLKGTKIGCGLEQCGACTVLADGEAVQSCATPVAVFADQKITTVEGLADTEDGRRVQEAFMSARAAQCGYCTAGLVVKVTALARAGADAERNSLKDALTGHLCRCGSHPRVLQAAEAVLGENR